MKARVLVIMAILGILLVSSICIIPTDDNSATENTSAYEKYGSETVGAKTITFHPNTSECNGLIVRALAGVDIYLPTECKDRFTRDGYVLLGWSETKAATVPAYYPGTSFNVWTDKELYAIWGPLEYDCSGRINHSTDSKITEAQHLTVEKGKDVTLDTSEDYGSIIMMKALKNKTSQYTLSVRYNGENPSQQTVTSIENGIVAGDKFTLVYDGDFTLTGSTSKVGIHEITLRLQTKDTGDDYGDRDDVNCKWYVSVYDPNTDPTTIYQVTYNGTKIGYGPYHTAIQLPDADKTSSKQNGWFVYVDQALTTYPIGGAYTIVENLTLEPSYYSDEEIKDNAGVIAYNANGGYYKGQFATVVTPGGTVTLTEGSIVTKSGYTFVGWNASGSSSNAIYPAGYSYKIDDDTKYTELKAVWSTSSLKATLKYVNTDNGLLSSTLSLCKGYEYIHPTTVSEPSGYTFKGWSETPYAKGEGTAIDEKQVRLSSDKTFYTVFEKNEEETKTVTVTFVGRTSAVAITKIQSGETVNAVTAPDVDNMAFDAWYHNGERWDFDTVVTEDMTLQAKYIRIFDLQIDGTSVKVILNVPSSSTKVTYSSDGHTETFVGEAPKAHSLEAGTSGYVTVVVTTENGEYTSKCPYAIEDDNGGGKEKETVNIDLTYFVLGLAIVGMIVFAYRRGYL